LQISYGCKSDQGRVRSSNEDSCVANGEYGLFLVADGMGGHAAGEVASQLAAATVEEIVGTRDNHGERHDETLRRAALEANTRVFETQRLRPEFAGMGCTLTALSFRDNHYYIAHVGDSRAYRLRKGVLDQLTRDHSLVWHLYENGVLGKDDLASHPQKNLITRSIGPHPQVDVDLEQGEAHEGDVYLLCSDGLTDVLTDEGIRQILAAAGKTPQELGDNLVSAANRGGGPDNISVIVLRIEGCEDGEAPEDAGNSGPE
jgi:serine/threonine protein phosphatase PrpC